MMVNTIYMTGKRRTPFVGAGKEIFMRYCSYCGNVLEDGDKFCVKCGKPVPDSGNGKMNPGGHPAYQGSLDPTYRHEPAGSRDHNAMGGSLHYGSGDGGGRGNGGDDSDDFRNKAAVIIAAFAVLILACVLGFLVTRTIFHKDKNTGSGNTLTYRETDSSYSAGEDGQAADIPNDTDSAVEDTAEDSAANAEEKAAAEEAERKREAEEKAAAEEAERKKEAEEKAAAEEAERKREAEEKAAAEKAAAEEAERKKEAEEKAAAEEAERRREAEEKAAEDIANKTNLTGVDDPEKLSSTGSEGGAGTDGSYILTDSDKRKYSRSELSKLDNYSLQMAINELYARHGRKFDTPEIQEYFNSKSWYKGTIEPEDFDGNESVYFNQFEISNRELLAKIREERAAKKTP